jgi:hypothetical protein
VPERIRQFGKMLGVKSNIVKDEDVKIETEKKKNQKKKY